MKVAAFSPQNAAAAAGTTAAIASSADGATSVAAARHSSLERFEIAVLKNHVMDVVVVV